MRLMRTIPYLAGVLAVGLAVWWLSAPDSGEVLGQEVPAEGIPVHVRGRVVSALGRPIGATFAVCGGEPLQLLGVGRTDAAGEIEVEVSGLASGDRVLVLCESVGWIGNGYDEVRSSDRDGPRRTAALEFVPAKDGGVAAGWDWMHLSGRALDEIGGCPPGTSRVVLRERRPNLVDVDQVCAGGTCSGEAAVDVGELRFASYRAACEIEVTVEGGAAEPPDLYLGGYAGAPEKPGGNPMYPHFALSRRGDRVRVLMDRAAARLLRHDTRSLPSLLCTDDRHPPAEITLSAEEYAKVGDERTVLQATVRLAAASSGEQPRTPPFRQVPDLPDLWWFMEPALR